MGNNPCCNVDKEERHEIETTISGVNQKGRSLRPSLQEASSDKVQNKIVKKEVLQVNHSGVKPQDGTPQDYMYKLSLDAQSTFDIINSFEPKTEKPSGDMVGPYKFANDKFNFNYLLPAVTNHSIEGDVSENDTTYYGQMNSIGKREGFGILTSSDGHHFSGFFVDDSPLGEGRLIFNNGDFLIGNFKGNNIDGQGELHFMSRETVFKGQFKNNMPNGQGDLNSEFCQDGYSGKWKNGKKHGFGIERWEDGTVYEGSFFEDQKHGNGKFIWPDGATYQGQFYHNAIEGQGTHSWADGRLFIGGWKDNKMHGKYPIFLLILTHWLQERVYSPGKMEPSTKGSTLMIKKKDMGNFIGNIQKLFLKSILEL